MRSLALSLLLASALVPAAAIAGPDDQQRQRHARATEDSGGGQRQRAQRSSSRGDEDGGQRQRVQRSLGDGDGAQRQRAASSVAPSEPRQRPDWAEGRGGMQEATEAPRRRDRAARRAEAAAEVPSAPAVQQQQVFGERRRENRRRRGDDSAQASSGTTAPAGGVTTAHRRDRNWSTHWRNDHRYDWRRHRERNRSLFRLGFYYDPYGYSYRRWMVGWNLWPSYYRSNHWLDDPWMYRLPPAYGPYRWVRYWDDALLVNTYTGQVVDVLYNFFW